MRWALLLLVFAHGLLAQDLKDNFVLDKSKPFAYLALDHIGPRKPVQQGEGTEGIWLHLVNNSRIPIILRAQGTSSGERGSILEDEVVADVPVLQITSTPQEIDASPGRGLKK